MTAATKSRPVRAADLGRDPVHWLAFGLGAGLSPKAPGTVGSLWGIVLFVPLASAEPWLQWGVAAFGFAAGVILCDISSRRLGVHDHPGIVVDEVVGCYLTLLLAPAGVVWIAAGFAAFRLFDIVKPRPIRDLDHRLGGGLGIMLDDVVAALYAALLLLGLDWLIGWLTRALS
ncbi:MAG: phosphatidylglycerophosphatase A [Pseudomonadota bacterium]